MILGGLDRTQKEIASRLDALAKSRALPNAILFSGNNCTGRMFAARQLCLALKVQADNVIIVSDRNHSFRILTAVSLFSKHKNTSSKGFLRDSIEVLLQQYHGALLDGQNTAAGKKKFSDASEVSELLKELDRADENDAEAVSDRLMKAVYPLLDKNRTVAITVGQVRAVRDWCMTSSMEGGKKIVIIEGLENSGDSAVNALLKILEEPPENVHFILISSNEGKIPATILSRASKFRFRDLGPEEKKYILSGLFVDPSKYESLSSFFLEGSGINDRLLSDAAKALILKQKIDMPALVSELEKNQGWDIFFDHVLSEINDAFTDGRMNQRTAEYLAGAINEAVIKGKTFNQNKRLTFDFVVYRTQEVNR
ncbi:MAG: hypothetical protein ACTTJW_02745 [Sphaerochaeta sp.]